MAGFLPYGQWVWTAGQACTYVLEVHPPQQQTPLASAAEMKLTCGGSQLPLSA